MAGFWSLIGQGEFNLHLDTPAFPWTNLLEDKLMCWKEAVAAVVLDDDYVATGRFGTDCWVGLEPGKALQPCISGK